MAAAGGGCKVALRRVGVVLLLPVRPPAPLLLVCSASLLHAALRWPVLRWPVLRVGRAGVHDQGHVAVLLGHGPTSPLLQSYSDCKVEPCPETYPGVNSNLTLEEAYRTKFFANFTYAVAPEDWLVATGCRKRGRKNPLNG